METTESSSSLVTAEALDLASVERSYYDVIRVVAATRLDGVTPPGVVRLTGSSAVSLSCTTPSCTSGTPPLTVSDPSFLDIQATARVDTPSSGGRRLLVESNGLQLSIPVLDVPLEARLNEQDGLRRALAAYRAGANMTEHGDFHVYWIADAPAGLSQLVSTWIAIPVPCTGCGTAAG